MDPNYKFINLKNLLHIISSTIEICGEMSTRIFYLRRNKTNYLSNVSKMVALLLVMHIRSKPPSNDYLNHACLETLLSTAHFPCGMSCCSQYRSTYYLPQHFSFRHFMVLRSSLPVLPGTSILVTLIFQDILRIFQYRSHITTTLENFIGF